MSAEHVYRIASSGWLHCHGHQVEEVPAWPRLTHSALEAALALRVKVGRCLYRRLAF